MRLTVIGSSAAGIAPDSPASGYLVETPGAGILLDCGPGVIWALRQSGAYDRVDAVVVSHMHVDHCLDLLSFAGARIRDEAAADVGANARRRPLVSLLLPPGGQAVIQALTEVFAPLTSGKFARPFEEAFAIAEYDPAAELKLGDACLRFTGPLPHTAPAWGIRVQAGGRALAYSGDSAYSPRLAELAWAADLFLCEATLLEPRPVGPPKHLTAGEAGRAAGEAGVGRLLLTHLYWTDAEWQRQISAAAGATYAGPLELTRAGQIYEV
jgi:ribonuclease BN (tRNA processing enzyme)